ncbi:MAG: hypothetical protein A2074_06370 [Candidatus Aquicultor primus]|uniref:Uncharacterized protein n=1 Tax=Candidatus Aquicultor primus TaxID=1797195 RepID=A0A1F2UMJ1_9ACTN|nr:MAG: hypothetical protein A2074_06370 [Candidatus Aquicultor primus]
MSMSTVYSIIDRSNNYDYHGSLSTVIVEKLELANINKVFAVRAAVHLASMHDLTLSLLKQIEQFNITDKMPSVAQRVITIWELAQSLKFHADIFGHQAREINSVLLDGEEAVDNYEVITPENRIHTDQWFKDRYCFIERAISNYVPRLVAVRWTYSLLELGNELFHLIDKLDMLTSKKVMFSEDIIEVWLDISQNWTAGETALIHLGNHVATGLDRVDPGLIGWSLVLVEELRIGGLDII